AKEAKNPQVSYPLSMLVSSGIILFIYIFGSLSIAFVVSPRDINLFAGLMQAFTEFFTAFNLRPILPIVVFLAVVGSLAGINTWIIGPAKGILASAHYGFLPPWMQKTNKKGMPIGTLFVQAIIASLLSMVFYFMPSVNAAFWIITALTVQFAMIMYILIFCACIKLRYSQPDQYRHYRIPGGKLGVWLVAGVGSLASSFAFFICYVPPSQIDTGNIWFFESFLLLGLIGLSLPPIYFIFFRKAHWQLKAL
ncbi:MAG TPA: APC family permease, partial [Gammaproteobacteria bacterium]|nr:APC family permease [Gammaproteobacteria bacterium]